MTTARSRLASARAAVRAAESDFARAGERQADEAAAQRKLELAAKQKAAQKPAFRMSPAIAAAKFAYDAGLPEASEKWIAEIFARLDALENSSTTPAHLKGMERRG